ncbi:MAG: hydroxyacylglutathione hydrolase [Brevundimonas sp.]|jgi:hydroxyacylglutathione hydrolase|uniref:hydroxyacylglutathione hydrolase n=1 Tax=Brevundimonas sp. TaxID=1871086 RepID=UPI0039189C73
MALEILQFPCLIDNYGFLVRCPGTGVVASIDAPEAEAVIAALDQTGWGRLDLILNTHWHGDHTGGNGALHALFGCEILGPEEVRRAAPLDRALAHGDEVRVGEVRFQVLATPGHTLGHIVYRCMDEPLAFVGDTLFALGCGRLFEGTAAQMFESLRLTDAWPGETRIYCAHEYTLSNARFALSVDERPEMKAHADAINALRASDQPTVPTTLAVERRFNPFLRADSAEAFAALRAAKDSFG